MKTVAWFSGVVSSFVSIYLMRNEIDEVIYIHIDDQHPDTQRFVRDCAAALCMGYKTMQSKYKTVDEVIRKFRYINGVSGARCTQMLKTQVRSKWEKEQYETLLYVWGYDVTEQDRAKRIEEKLPQHIHRFPLIRNNLTKQDCHGMLARLGIKRPAMYDLGYQNNNCIGCVKGGMGYWNKTRIDFPDAFSSRAKLEREIGHSCINGVYLDELEPHRGNITDEIMDDCSILCELAIGSGK